MPNGNFGSENHDLHGNSVNIEESAESLEEGFCGEQWQPSNTEDISNDTATAEENQDGLSL